MSGKDGPVSKADLENRIKEWDELRKYWYGQAAKYRIIKHDPKHMQTALAEVNYLNGLIEGSKYRLNNGLYDQTP